MSYAATEDDLTTYSDLYKCATGCRPRSIPSFASQADFRAELVSLAMMAEAEVDREKAVEARNLAALETQIDTMVADFGITRATALRWLVDAEGSAEAVAHYGMDAFCFARGISCAQAKPLADLLAN